MNRKACCDYIRSEASENRPQPYIGIARLFGLILAAVILAPLSYADEIVIIDEGTITTGPITPPDTFVTCDCGGGRLTISNGLENCASACALLPPPTVVSSCSGVSVDGTRTLGSADRIVQCGPDALFPGGLGTLDQVLLDTLIPREQSAVDTVLSAHLLPEADRGKVMGFARDEARAFLFADMLAMAQKPDLQRTNAETRIVVLYAEEVRKKRLDAALFAQSEFNRWNSVVCDNFGTGYVPPLGFTYPSQGSACLQLGQVFGGPVPPSSKEFIAYGTAHAYNKLNTDAQTAAIAIDTAQNIGFGVVLAGAGLAGVATGAFLALTTLGTTIITAVAPFIGSVVVTSALATAAQSAAAITATAASIGFTVAVVIVAIAIAVLQGIAVFEAAAIPGELQAQVTAAQVSVDLRESIKTKEGQQELFGVFIESTMPDFFATSAPPAAIASDRRFLVRDENLQKVGVFPTIDFQSPSLPGVNWEARMSGGWFVPKHVQADNNVLETLSLSIAYFDWEGKKHLAWRRGNQFVITNLDATTADNAGAVFPSILYKDWDGRKLIASIAVDDTSPVITPNVTGALGNESWYTSNVNITWTVEDLESAIQSKTGCGDRSITSDGISSFTCEASSEGGTGSSPLTIKRDATNPDIAGSRSPGANANGWNNASVSVSFTCSDATSGIASCGSNQTVSSEGANQSATGNAIDKAGNSKDAVVSGINIDKTSPVVSVTGVANGATYTVGSVPTAGCSTSDTLSDVETVATVSVTGGNANGAGTFTASCTGAKDKAGNPAATSVSFEITIPTPGDIDLDTDVDNNDLARITAVLNTPAAGPNDPRDINGDRRIDALDARKLVLLCTRPRCATQ